MRDVLLLCFCYRCVNCGRKAFSKIVFQLAGGHSVELIVFYLLDVIIPG